MTINRFQVPHDPEDTKSEDDKDFQVPVASVLGKNEGFEVPGASVLREKRAHSRKLGCTRPFPLAIVGVLAFSALRNIPEDPPPTVTQVYVDVMLCICLFMYTVGFTCI